MASEEDSDSDGGVALHALSLSDQPRATVTQEPGVDIDTLDVSTLSYRFKLFTKKSGDKPIRQQFISIKSFLTKLDKNNRQYRFTRDQYCRAWEHAVRLHEKESSVSHMYVHPLSIF